MKTASISAPIIASQKSQIGIAFTLAVSFEAILHCGSHFQIVVMSSLKSTKLDRCWSQKSLRHGHLWAATQTFCRRHRAIPTRSKRRFTSCRTQVRKVDDEMSSSGLVGFLDRRFVRSSARRRHRQSVTWTTVIGVTRFSANRDVISRRGWKVFDPDSRHVTGFGHETEFLLVSNLFAADVPFVVHFGFVELWEDVDLVFLNDAARNCRCFPRNFGLFRFRFDHRQVFRLVRHAVQRFDADPGDDGLHLVEGQNSSKSRYRIKLHYKHVA